MSTWPIWGVSLVPFGVLDSASVSLRVIRAHLASSLAMIDLPVVGVQLLLICQKPPSWWLEQLQSKVTSSTLLTGTNWAGVTGGVTSVLLLSCLNLLNLLWNLSTLTDPFDWSPEHLTPPGYQERLDQGSYSLLATMGKISRGGLPDLDPKSRSGILNLPTHQDFWDPD